jgi:hypothetical protein
VGAGQQGGRIAKTLFVGTTNIVYSIFISRSTDSQAIREETDMTYEGSPFDDNENGYDEYDDDEYDDMELLERLETLREDMEELGVTTLQEVIQRINELHQLLDGR